MVTTGRCSCCGSPSRSGELLVGRSGELAALDRIADRVRHGECVALSVEGGAGCGKTALLGCFVCCLHDFAVLRSAGDPSEKDLSWGLVGQLLRDVPKRLLKRYPALTSVLTVPTSRVKATVFNVGLQLACLLDDLTDVSPVAIITDDVVWADWRSLHALRITLDRMRENRLLVVAAVNASFSDSTDAADRLFASARERIRLPVPGLDAAAVAEIARDLMPGNRWSPGVLEKLWQRTEGNPLYVRSVLAHASVAGPDDLRWVMHIPESLSAAVHHRFTTLEPDARRLVEALAVFDSAVAVETAGRVADVDDPERALRQPIDIGMVERAEHQGAATACIPHRIQRDAVYITLGPTRRRELHRAAALAVSGPARWMHRVAAADSSDMAQVANELERAAEEPIADGDVDLAATWLQWAAELSDRREARERRLLTAVIHLLSGRRLDRATPLLSAAAKCASSPLKECALGMASAWQGDRVSAERRLSDVIDATRDRPGVEWVAAEAGGVLASLYAWHGLGAAALRAQRDAMSIGHEIPHLVGEAGGVLLTARLLRDGPSAVVKYLDRPREDRASPPTGSPGQAGGYFLAWASVCRILAGQLTAGRDEAIQALAVEEFGRTSAFTGDLAYYSLAAACYWMGRWQEADEAAQRAISLAVAFEHPWACARAYAVGAFVAASRGQWERAAGLIGESEVAVSRTGPPQYAVFPAMARAVMAQAHDDHPAMLRALLPVLELPGANAWREVYAAWWLPLHVEALISCSRLGDAETALSRLRALPAGQGDPPPTVFRLTGRLCEARGDVADAVRHYRTALQNPSGSQEVPLQRSLTEQDCARAVALTGNDTEAIQHLRSAYHGFEALGAQPFLQRCRDQLTTALRR